MCKWNLNVNNVCNLCILWTIMFHVKIIISYRILSRQLKGLGSVYIATIEVCSSLNILTIEGSRFGCVIVGGVEGAIERIAIPVFAIGEAGEIPETIITNIPFSYFLSVCTMVWHHLNYGLGPLLLWPTLWNHLYFGLLPRTIVLWPTT